MAMNKLTAIKINQAKPGDKPIKLSDGGGMYLLIDPKGGKYWRFDYRFEEKRKTLALGTFPEVTVDEARRALATARKQVKEGIDPSAARKVDKLTSTHRANNTFEAVAREWHSEFLPTWTKHTGEKNIRILEINAFPWIGNRPIAEVSAPELLAIIRKVKDRGLLDTAHRLRMTAGQVFRYGIVTGRCERDIAADLRGALPAHQKRHFAAITDPVKFGQLLRDIWAYQGQFSTACAFKLSALFGLRPGEIRSLEWSEVDTDNGQVRIPLGKMKSRRLHIVPLCRQAAEIFEALQPLTGSRRFCFPSLQNAERPMSENTINAALRRMGYDTQSEQSAHGFRSSFSTMAHGSGSFRMEVVEIQLAHKHGDGVRLAYDRGEYLEERRKLMQWWADECDRMREGAAIIPLQGKTAA